LYFFVQSGCDHCREAEPHVLRLAREHALRILVITLHLDRKEWHVLGWQPKGTPGYALVDGTTIVRKTEGLMDYGELVSWIEGKAVEGAAEEEEEEEESEEEEVEEDDVEDEEDEEEEVA